MANTKDPKYKEYIKLQERSNELWKKLIKLPNVKLAKPYQNGWTIEYDIRSDIKRRADYPNIKKALEVGFGISYTKNVKVVRAIRTKDTTAVIKGKWHNNPIFDFYPLRRYVKEEEFNNFSGFSKYYYLDTTSERYTKYKRKYYYCDFPSYWLVLKVKPNMITHRYIKGGEIEKEYRYLQNRLWYSGEFNHCKISYSKSFPAFKDRSKVRGKIRKFMSGDIEDIYNDRIPLEYYY